MSSPLRVRLDYYPRVYGRLRSRALVLLVLGSIGLVIGAFLSFLGLLLAIVPDGGLWEKRSSFFVGIIGGLFPLVGSIIAIWRGLVGRRRAHRARDLVALARLTPVFSSRDAAQHLGMRPMDAERTLLDALASGLVEEAPTTVGPRTPDISQTRLTATRSPADFAVAGPVAALPAPSFAAGQAAFAPPLPVVGAPTVSASMIQTPMSPPRAPRSAPPASTEALVGTVLNGTYRIEALLGSGGMGAVYAARHLRTGRRYAVKTLLADAQFSPDAIRRFEREASAASALGHPGIVAIHDFHATEAGLFYLVMDLLEGETLDQRLARLGSLPWPDARRVTIEAGEALAAAHDAGLLHRDLKPANLFLSKIAGGGERVVLLDFGLAKPISDAAISKLTSTGTAVGTPLYMAPEQARGESLDVRCDVYGLGAVLYEMLTGAPPFFDRTLAAVYARLLTESTPSAVRAATHPVPSAVDDLLACTLAKNPTDRFNTVRAFLGALSHVGAAVQRAG